MRVLIVGRSPNVLLEAVDILRSRGYQADATNQFADVLSDYDVADLDILIFGGMVPAETKQYLREEVAKVNPAVTFVQGLAGMSGLIAAQVDAVATTGGTAGTATADAPAGASAVYDSPRRSMVVTLTQAVHVVVEAWWGTSFQPPEPRSAHAIVFDGQLSPGEHVIALPADLPDVASFAAVRIDGSVHVFTVGEMPAGVTRLAPASLADQRLPPVAAVRTRS